jgi:hypothetical protein
MKRPALVLTVSALAVATAGFFAVDRGMTAMGAEQEWEYAQRDLGEALRLAARHPRMFGPTALPTSGSPLKSLAQDSATACGVTIGFLSENEREREKGRREVQVVLRLVSAPHGNLVRFLRDLEERGTGARIREIHVRPSRENSESYEEVEIVLARIVASEGGRP